VTKAIDIETLRDAAPAPMIGFCCDSGDAPLPCRPTSHLFGEFRRRAGLDGKYNRDNVVVPPITTPIPDRSRVAPFAIDGRTLRAWMRGADLDAPKWKTAAIYFPERPPGVIPPGKELFAVPATSVVRARARADAARPRPPQDTRWFGADYRRTLELIREIGQNWTAPACQAVDYATTIGMMLDGLFDKDTGIATEQRVYRVDELATAKRWLGTFSDAMPDATGWYQPGGARRRSA
jgi:hypothetical protein